MQQQYGPEDCASNAAFCGLYESESAMHGVDSWVVCHAERAARSAQKAQLALLCISALRLMTADAGGPRLHRPGLQSGLHTECMSARPAMLILLRQG